MQFSLGVSSLGCTVTMAIDIAVGLNVNICADLLILELNFVSGRRGTLVCCETRMRKAQKVSSELNISVVDRGS